MELSAVDVRVLGCLIEKEQTTPDQYPLTTNSLRLACNQKTNREPVVDFSEVVVDQAMLRLRQAGLARTVSSQGMRASKHRHVLDEALGLDREELAVLAVLMLRGPQTSGELRTRTDRAASFDSLADVESTLEGMATRTPDPLVRRLERRPGQKEERWLHILGDEQIDEALLDTAPPARSSGASPTAELTARVARLETDLAMLRGRFDELCQRLGVEPDDVPAATG
jgi:uncharacterized protein YceH (UPF0502 family)